MGPSRSLGPVLSCPVPGPSRDFPGRDSPAGKPSRVSFSTVGTSGTAEAQLLEVSVISA